MPIKQSIESDLKTALLSGDKSRAAVLRGLKSAILNVEIAKGKRQEGLTDEEVTQLLSKEVKSRVESAQLYEKGGANDRAENELAEKAIIEEYLPAQMTDEELQQLVAQKAEQVQASTMQDMGKVIGAVKQEAKGSADGSRIAAAVKEHLQ